MHKALYNEHRGLYGWVLFWSFGSTAKCCEGDKVSNRQGQVFCISSPHSTAGTYISHASLICNIHSCHLNITCNVAAVARERLVEALCEVDDECMELYLESGELDSDALGDGLRRACIARNATIVLLGSALKHRDIQQAAHESLAGQSGAVPWALSDLFCWHCHWLN